MMPSKRAALRVGFVAVIGLLIFSTVEAYRIQDSVSERHLEIYREYVAQDRALAQLRLDLWLAGNYVRDFFISTTPEHADQFRRQLAALEADCDRAIGRLQVLNPDRHSTQGVERGVHEFWAVLRPVPATMLTVDDPGQYEFLQREIVPRRDALYEALRDMTASDQASLQRREKRFAETRLAAARRLLLTLGICVLLGILVARFSLGHADKLERETQRQYEEVAQARRDLQQLSARLLTVEEEGRKRLSRELHDEIGQSLAVMQIELSGAQALASDPVLAERLAGLGRLAERSVQTVRNISALLRPSLLDDLGLVPALQYLLEDFLRRNRIAGEISDQSVDDDLPDAVKTCVYRVVQEALHNCEKHAHAGRVRIALRQAGNCLHVDIEDDGSGFAVDSQGAPARRTGFGILGMRERVAIAGGSLLLDSAPGRGTRISLALPLAPAAAPPAPIAQEIHA